MAQKTKQTLKSYFETGDIPTQGNYVNLIDSNLNLNETGTQILVGTLSSSFLEVENHITASGNISSSGILQGSDLILSNAGGVSAEIQSSAGDSFIRFTDSGSHKFCIGFDNGDSTFAISTGSGLSNNQAFTINNSGSVGIGTTSPTSKLDVAGNINTTSHITASLNISSSGIIYGARIYPNGPGGPYIDEAPGNTGDIGSSAGLFATTNITASGNISASGTVKANEANITGHLTASGNISASGTVEATAFTLNGTIVGSSTDTFWNSGSLGNIFYNGGNIGIGTSSPLEKLTVVGNISASGTITAQSASFSRINFGGNDGDMVFSGSAQQTGSIGHLILSDNSLQIGGASGPRFSKSDLSNLKEGKPLALEEAVGGFSSIIRPQAIMSTLNTADYQKWTTAGRIGTFLGGELVHDMNFGLGHNYISMGKPDATTKVSITGSLEVSGSSTFTNWGNFRNRMHKDKHAFEVSTDPTSPGGFREGMATPHLGTAPHLHFMLSGSGQAGVGLLNPQHTLHVSASSGDFNALQVEGDTVINGCLTANAIGNPSTISSNTTIPAGYNIQLLTSFTNPSITIAAGVNYTVSAGADVTIT